ncbi:MAG: class I SAM-dependent methyltransferase [Candidatus Levybacteria bacterium]|nr:class I SAM-dependent methyltransferase [Candidatus Levybacteria bacterium]
MRKRNRTKQELYDRWHKEVYQLDIEKSIKDFSFSNRNVMQALGITSKTRGRLLDVACGKGLLIKQINEKNNYLELYGSDISRYAITNAKKIVPNATFSVDDGEALSFTSSQFDFVSCLGGLEYYQNPVKGAREIARVLKNNGRAVIFVPNLMFVGYVWLALRRGLMPTHGGTTNSGENIYDYNNEKFYTYQGWREVLAKGGLEIESASVYNHLGGTRFAHPLIIKLYNVFFNKFVPFNLSYCFIFVCRKK